MRRARLIGISTLSALALAATAGAGVPPPDSIKNDYEGRIGNDSSTYVGFDVVKKDGVKKVKAFGAYLRYKCDGQPGGSVFGEVRGSFKVKDKRFGGTRSVEPALPPMRGSGFDEFDYEVHGKLGKRGKAEGTIKARLELVPVVIPRGGGNTKCATKPRKLDWTARKGANTDPEVVTRRLR